MASNKKMARTAGFIYLVLITTGIFTLMYVPSQLIVWEDPELTLRNITNRLMLYKLGVVMSFLSTLSFLALGLALHRLLHKVHKNYALVLMSIIAICVAYTFGIILNQVTVVSLIENANRLPTVNTTILQTQVMFYLEQYNQGIIVAQIFWGLWLLPFGYLVYTSDFLPKFFGVFLMLGCFGYVITFLGDFLIEGYGDSLFATIAGIPADIGELGICLWLLIAGAKNIPDREINI